MAGTGKPTINHDSIDNLDNKIENQGTTTQGKLSAAEFNQLVHSVQTEQTNVTTLLNNGVFGVKLPGQNAVYPNNEGIVELGSSNAGVQIATAGNQRVFNFYDNNIVISMAVVVNDGNQAATGESVTLEIYRGSGATPVKTLTIQSAYNNPAQESDYVDVNLSDVVLSDVSNYRVRAIGTLTPLESTLSLTINYTNVYVEALNSPTSIFRVDTVTKTLEGIHYYAYGDLNEGQYKTLYVRVHDDVESSSPYYEQAYDLTGRIEYNGDFVFSVAAITSNPDLVKHGVHLIEAFCTITEDDPENPGEYITIYTSETVSRRFMFVNDVTDRNIYILLQDISPSIENYTQSMICSFSLFKPLVIDGVISTDTTTDIDIRFQLDYRYQGQSATCAILNSTLRAGILDTLVLEPEATQIGSDEPSSYQAQIYAYHTYLGDAIETDLIAESGYSAQEVTMTLINNAELSPVPGAIFVINPKLHSSSNNGTIFNDKDATQAVVSSTWNIHGNGLDGWLYNNVLRLIANDTIEITQANLRPFGLFKYGSGVEVSDRSMAIEFDMKVSNVTDETKPIITIGYTDSNQRFKGIKLFPTMGYVFTKSAYDTKNQDFQWEEGQRVHIGITVTYQVECNYGDNTYRHYLNLIRVFLDGQCQREIVYTVDNPEASWTDDDYQFPVNANIVLGGESADLDIYSLRLYSAKALSAPDSLKDYIATKATTAEKMEIYNRNQITYAAGTANAGRISANLVRGIGKNVLIWYGPECKNAVPDDPFPANTSGAGGYWGIWQYNSDGTLDDLHSGYLCKATGVKEYKSQGTTAKTYYYHNIQTKVKGRGNIPVNWQTDIDSNYITVTLGTGADEGKVILNGGGFSNKKFEYDENNMISVPDGWVSFGGLYRGAGFQVTADSPFAVKLVNKINYASAMQSHLDGGVMSYNDLHKAVVGANALQRGTNVRVTKCVQPFFFFVEDENHADSPVYRGLCTFGSGKADDPTWGYTGQTTFMMVEGASNNAPLADMRVPWDDEVEPSFDDGEQDGWIYDGATNVDLDKCTFVTDEQNQKICNPTAEALVKKAFNYLYWHNPNIEAYEGTRQSLLNDPTGLSLVKSYWTSDHYLMRYNFKTSSWVDAGFKGSTLISDTNTYYKRRKLDTQVNLENDEDYNDSVILAGVNWDAPTTAEITEQIINAYAAHAAQDPTHSNPASHGLSQYFKINSLLFHYAYVNYYIAGTDNCSKNTYYVFIPGDDVFELHQDDLDTIFMTDNSGNQTKPYYIDRQHPYDDEDTGHTNILYEGKDNVLFNLCERMFGGYNNDQLASGTTIRLMMYSIFRAMYQSKGSIWDFMDSYFFAVQKYFPEVAWNEQAMVRYEYPQAIGYNPTMAPKPGRDIPPITQSIGSQLQAEKQYMKRRTILAASYAHFGSLGGGIENIGIDECSNSFGTYTTNIGNYKVKFKVKAFQYIYPSWVNGDQAYSTCQRIGPNDGYFLLPEFLASAADQVCSLQGSNFYTMVDDETGERMGDNPFYAETFNAKGNRLKKFISHPVTNPSVDQPGSGITTSVIFQGIRNENIKTFNCEGIPNVSEFDIQGCVYTNPSNLSSLIHATRIILKDSAFDSANSQSLPINGSMEVLDLRGTPTVTTNIADCDTLQTIYVSHQCVNLTLTNCPNLTSIIIENESGRTSALENITLSGLTSLSQISLVPSVKNVAIANCPVFTTITNGTTSGLFTNLVSFNAGGINSAAGYSLSSQAIFDNIYNSQKDLPVRNIQVISLSNVNWSNIDTDHLIFLLSLDQVNNNTTRMLTGLIGTDTSSNVVNFERKLQLIRKFGNVDDTASANYKGLIVVYRKTALTSVVVSGPMYTRELGDYQYYIKSTTANGNNFVDAIWSADAPSVSGAVEISINSTTGLLSVESGALTTACYTTVRCTVKQFDYNSTYQNTQLPPGSTAVTEDNQGSRKVYLYDRQAKVGDFVYADGDYSDQYDSQRTLIGVCVFVGDHVNTPDDYVVQDKMPRLAVCCKDLALNVGGTNTSTFYWGLYIDSGWSWNTASLPGKWYKANPTWPTQYEVVGHDTMLTPATYAFYLEDTANYDCYFLGRTSWGDCKILSTSTSGFSSSYLNASSCASFNDGYTANSKTTQNFLSRTSTTATGSGFAFDNGDVLRRTIPSDSAFSDFRNVLPRDSENNFIYGPGDVVNMGFMSTMLIIMHRDKLLADSMFSDFQVGRPSGYWDGDDWVSESVDLGNRMYALSQRIQYLVSQGGIAGETYYAKYRQLYFPAASVCYAYEPTVGADEVLADKFKVHNWFLPTEGQLLRMYYYYNSAFHTDDRLGDDYNTGETIFAHANRVSGGRFSNFGVSYYWSSTENSSQSNSWNVLFTNGYIYYNFKYNDRYCRALVAF